MFELVFAAGLLASSEPSYDSAALYAFVAAENDRVIDGVAYADGEGVLSAGLLFAHPAGFFASSELAGFGGGGALPADEFLLLQSAAGWRVEGEQGSLAMELLDYRLAEHGSEHYAHNGIALRYSRDALTFELGVESDAPYYYAPYRRFFEYDLKRASASWQHALDDDWRLSLGAGVKQVERIPGNFVYASANLGRRWQGFEWQVTVIGSEDRSDWFAPEATGSRILFRVARPFNLR